MKKIGEKCKKLIKNHKKMLKKGENWTKLWKKIIKILAKIWLKWIKGAENWTKK